MGKSRKHYHDYDEDDYFDYDVNKRKKRDHLDRRRRKLLKKAIRTNDIDRLIQYEDEDY